MNEPSLSELRDIAEPAAPGLWPLAPGLWLVLAIVFSVSLLLTWFLVERWHRNAYRRAGLLLLAEARSLYDLSVLLKRVALAVFPRGEVASLHGPEWVAFLERTSPGLDLSGLAAGEGTAPAGPELKQAAASWIRFHRPPDPRMDRGKATT